MRNHPAASRWASAGYYQAYVPSYEYGSYSPAYPSAGYEYGSYSRAYSSAGAVSGRVAPMSAQDPLRYAGPPGTDTPLGALSGLMQP